MSSTVEIELSARRRRRASMACLTCRKSRIRCKVEPGQSGCTQCRQTGVTCAFDSRDGRKNRANSKVVANELSKRIQELESLLKQSGQGHAIPERLRSPGSAHGQLELRHPTETDSESQSQPTPAFEDEPPPYTDISQQASTAQTSDAAAQSKTILGKLIPHPVKFDMASGRVRFFGPTTTMHILSRSTSDPTKVPESFWPISTLVRDLSPDTHNYLIDLFFDCHNSALHIVHKWAFFDDLKSGGTQFYSNFLHMAMLAEGYRYADINRADIKRHAAPAQNGDSSTFHTKAKKMAELELLKPGGIPSIQGFSLLGDLEVGIGRDDTGWMFSGMAFRLLFDVGLHVDPSELRLTEREVQIRHMVLWACIMNDVYWALYLGRPTMLKSSDIAPACLNKDFDRLIESQTRTYAYEKTIETRVYEALLQLMDLLEPLCETRDLRKNGRLEDAYLKIATLDRRLGNWYAELPERLRWTEENVRTAPSSFYLLHTQYHTALILLHRTFPAQPQTQSQAQYQHLRQKSTARPIPSSSTHFSTLSRNVCVSNAIQVADIISAYRTRYSLQRIFVTGLQHVGTAATALMAEVSMLPGEGDVAERGRLSEHLRSLMESMREMSETYQPAVLMASVVGHFIRDSSLVDVSRDESSGAAPTHNTEAADAAPSRHPLTAPSTQGTRETTLAPPNLLSSHAHIDPRATGTNSLDFSGGGLPFLPPSWFEEQNWEEDNEFLNLMGLKDLQGLGGGAGGGLMEGFDLDGGEGGGL